MRRRARRRSSGVPEQLEERTLLSAVGGDVAAATDAGGNLVVTGDAADNAIWIKQDAAHGDHSTGTVWLWGEDGTTINGQAYPMDAPLGISGLQGNVSVSLGDGDDQLYVYGLQSDGGLAVDVGAGVNEVYVDRSSIGGSVELLGGPDADKFYVDRTTVRGRLHAKTLGDADGVYVSLSQMRNIRVYSGRGNDGVYLHDVDVKNSTRIRGGKGRLDYFGTDEEYDPTDAAAGANLAGFEEFGIVGREPDVMDVKLDDAVDILRRRRAGEDQTQQAIDQVMESLFLSNLVPLPTNTDGDPADPDEQDFQEHLDRMQRAIDELGRHADSRTIGTDETKGAAADARNFLQLTQEALAVIAGQTAFCDPGDGTNNQNTTNELTGPGCEFLQADDEGGAVVDRVLDEIFSRQVRSPFPIIFAGDLLPNEVVINTGPLDDGQCSAAIKEFQGVKAVVSARQLPIWVEPWFARARIVGFKTVWAFEFVPAEYIKTIAVCNNGGQLDTTVSSVTVHDRGLMHFWRFVRNNPQ